MSHFSTLKTKITSAETLKQSLRDLGIQVEEKALVRGFNGSTTEAALVAVLDGDYDLGWTQNTDGSFNLVADLWGVSKKHNQAELINPINQKYAVNATLAATKQRGLAHANVRALARA